MHFVPVFFVYLFVVDESCAGVGEVVNLITPGLLRAVPKWLEELYNNTVDSDRSNQTLSTPSVPAWLQLFFGNSSNSSTSSSSSSSDEERSIYLKNSSGVPSIKIALGVSLENSLFDNLPNGSDHNQKVCRKFGESYKKFIPESKMHLASFRIVTFDMIGKYVKGRLFLYGGVIQTSIDKESVACVASVIDGGGWELHYRFRVPNLVIKYGFEVNLIAGSKMGIIEIHLGSTYVYTRLDAVGSSESCTYNDLGMFFKLNIKNYKVNITSKDYKHDFDRDNYMVKNFDWKTMINTFLVKHFLLSERLALMAENGDEEIGLHEEIVRKAANDFRSEVKHELCELSDDVLQKVL